MKYSLNFINLILCCKQYHYMNIAEVKCILCSAGLAPSYKAPPCLHFMLVPSTYAIHSIAAVPRFENTGPKTLVHPSPRHSAAVLRA